MKVDDKVTIEEKKKEVNLWIEQRRKNWPSKKRIAEKEETEQLKEGKGITTEKKSISSNQRE